MVIFVALCVNTRVQGVFATVDKQNIRCHDERWIAVSHPSQTLGYRRKEYALIMYFARNVASVKVTLSVFALRVTNSAERWCELRRRQENVMKSYSVDFYCR